MGPETFIGFIIGIISGIAALMLLKTLNSPLKKDATTIALIGELLALAAFMVGGKWASETLFKIIDIPFEAPEYYRSLAITFALIIIYPVFRLIIKLGEDFGRGAE